MTIISFRLLKYFGIQTTYPKHLEIYPCIIGKSRNRKSVSVNKKLEIRFRQGESLGYNGS